MEENSITAFCRRHDVNGPIIYFWAAAKCGNGGKSIDRYFWRIYFYLLNEGFGNLGLVYGVPPIIAAMLPSVLFLGFSILLLMRRQ